MKEFDLDGRRLGDIQAELFEQSTKRLNMSSEVFVRRFMNSKVATELDNLSFLETSETTDDIFEELDEQYGESDYGSVKYHHDSMYWAGYLYRCFAYVYDITSKQAYKLLPLKDVISAFEPYHSLDIMHAIERLLEEKNISFDSGEFNRRGVDLLKKIRSGNNRVDAMNEHHRPLV
ncbi:MAG: antitoxin [Bacilli bacterium]|nr:antitoxin [Bacilli bacterium]